MKLNKKNMETLSSPKIEKIHPELFRLPEKVIQFGTGKLLRGLPDDYIDQANKKGFFKGRIVIVKSTKTGGLDIFHQQDGLYTLGIKGITHQGIYEKYRINASISRVMDAHTEWQQILKLAEDPAIQIMLSNTTEAGIVEEDDDIFSSPPTSFPGKVAAYLYRRYQHLSDTEESHMVIIPTELIDNNAEKLKQIVLSLSAKHTLPPSFTDWINKNVDFCNSLVDRIVTDGDPHSSIGYTDRICITTEPFKLWAIEVKNKKTQEILSFAKEEESIKMLPSIESYKEIKLRLLNATHTLLCGISLLKGDRYVRESLADPVLEKFTEKLLKKEICPCLWKNGINKEAALAFSEEVVNRFKNPYLQHEWTSIALNFTAKIRHRVLPLLKIWFAHYSTPPLAISLGIASFLVLMDAENQEDQIMRIIQNRKICFTDQKGKAVIAHWKKNEPLVSRVFSDTSLWGENFAQNKEWIEVMESFVKRLKNKEDLHILILEASK